MSAPEIKRLKRALEKYHARNRDQRVALLFNGPEVTLWKIRGGEKQDGA